MTFFPGDSLDDDASLLGIAWAWLYRQHYPPNADIWNLRFRWSTVRLSFLHPLRTGTYQLSPMQCVGKATPRVIWSSPDVLALKWVELKIASRLPVHRCCEHVKGHRGGPASVQRMAQQLTQTDMPTPWVCRTDIKGYYANIDKAR